MIGRLDVDRLESPFQGAVFFNVLSVLIQRRGPDALNLAARQGRLQHIRGIDGSLRGPGADQRMEFIDEDNDIAGLDDLLHHDLETLFKLARGTSCRQRETPDPRR